MPTSDPDIHTAGGMAKGRCPATVNAYSPCHLVLALHSLYIYLCVFERLLIWRPQSNILKRAKRYAVVLFGPQPPPALVERKKKKRKTKS